jgi:AraC-like DNA-binding protein
MHWKFCYYGGLVLNNKNEKRIEFEKAIIDGVEIKRCEKSQQSYKKHLHHELSIGIIEEGSTVVEFGKVRYEFKEGDGVIIPSFMSHMCALKDIEHWCFIMLYIDPIYYEDKLHFDDVVNMNGECVAKLKAFIQSLQTETDDVLIEERLIELLVFLETNTQSYPKAKKNEANDGTYGQIKSFIELHYNQELSLIQIEEKFGINKFTLIRNFKNLFNTAPIAYQLQLKVAEVKKLILLGEDIFDICHKVGFYDQSHLIREFKKMNGISPTEYLNNFK